jgi:hypothetical protein
MSAPNFRPLGFGEILDGAFTLYRRNLVPFLVTALVPTVVVVLAFYLFGASYFQAILTGDTSALLGSVGGFVVAGLISFLAYMLLWGALTREVSQAYLGQPATVGDGMRTGMRKLLPILGAAFVIGVLFIVAYIAVLVLFVIIGVIGGASGSPAVAIVFGLIGGVLAVGAYLGAIGMFFAVLPAIIVEDKGPIEAVSRSFDLARGALGRVVGLMVVTVLITYLPILAVMMVTGGFASFADPSSMPTPGQFFTQQLLGMGAGVLTTPFMVAVIVLLYFDRRVRTEALDVQMAADRLAVAGS